MQISNKSFRKKSIAFLQAQQNNPSINHLYSVNNACLVAFFLCAITSFLYYNFYPELNATRHVSEKVDYVFLSILAALIFTMPLFVLAALIYPRAITILIAQVHASLYFTYLLILSFGSGSPGHSSPAAAFVSILEAFFYLLLFFEWLFIRIANKLRKMRGYDPAKVSFRRIFATITGTILSGWLSGFLMWCFVFPATVVRAAEQAAGNNPYCILAAGVTVRNLVELNPLSMYVRDHNGFTFTFHGMMIVDYGSYREYMNWSYKHGQFMTLGERTINNMKIDEGYNCSPTLHFARELTIF